MPIMIIGIFAMVTTESFIWMRWRISLGKHIAFGYIGIYVRLVIPEKQGEVLQFKKHF